MADVNEWLTQGLRKRRCLNPSPGRVTGVHRRVLTRLLWIPTPVRNASRKEASREMSGVSGLGSRRVVPTGRLAIWGTVGLLNASLTLKPISWDVFHKGECGYN
jgi:hypothetical protein